MPIKDFFEKTLANILRLCYNIFERYRKGGIYVDSLDKAILVCLSENARMTASAIAMRIRLSVSSVTERIKKLEESGVIEKYTLLVDSEAIDRNTEAYLEVTLENPSYGESFCSIACSIPEVLRCDLMAIEYDYLLFVNCESVNALDTLRTRLSSLHGVKGIKVRPVLHRYKRSISPLS